ncbi:MAG: imidazole glycerol phosphate synthase subunit HisH [Opitutales bacterium]
MSSAGAKGKPRIAVIDYGMSNLRSVLRAWEFVGGEVILAESPERIGAADALVFPGQGAIPDTMRLLRTTGFDRAVCDWLEADKPFFGICLGFQALFEHSEEGDTPGLGIFPGTVRRFRFDSGHKVPHMGWNAVVFPGNSSFTDGLVSGEDQFYFVHSYYAVPDETDLGLYMTDYGGAFVSGIEKGNCIATQFHPEKSQAKGLHLYANFLKNL